MLLAAAPRRPASSRHEPGRALDVREQECHRAGGRPDAGRPRRAAGGESGLVLLEDRPLEPPQLLPRLEPELLVEQAAAGLVDGERLGLAAAAVEREHELAAQALAQRVLADEPLQLGHELRVAAELEVGVDPLLERGEPLLLEAGALGACERRVELGERRPAPERERLTRAAAAASAGGGPAARATGSSKRSRSSSPSPTPDQVAGRAA